MKLNFIVTGASLMSLAVISGAFGAHGLKDKLGPDDLEIWNKAVFYQIIHALGLIICGILLQKSENKKVMLGGVFLLSGIIFFSGSLYLLALREISFTGTIEKVLGPITPLGGLFFIVGWILIAVGNHRRTNQ